jgi:cation transport regulator ChaC
MRLERTKKAIIRFPAIMALQLPVSTAAILEAFDNDPQPTVGYEVAGKLSGLHQTEGLADPERKGAWAEASAFNFHAVEDGSPWGTYYGPIFTATKQDGSPFYAPDIAEIDAEIVAHWETRSQAAVHPVLRARYADVVWDLKKRVTGTAPSVRYAQLAVDAYLDGISAKLYKGPPIHAAQAARRALHLALAINDRSRVEKCKATMMNLFDDGQQPGQHGVWIMIVDALLEHRKALLTSEDIEHLIAGLEHVLKSCSTLGDPGFDPWGAEAAARRLAAHYEREGKKENAQRVIRSYGHAFEQLAAEAGPMMAMAWLQPVHDEFKNRGMHEDATRVLAASTEKGKHVASDLKRSSVPIEFTEEQAQQLVNDITSGTPRDALLRIAAEFIPKTGNIKALLQEMFSAAPLMARIGVTRIVGDHFAAHAGSIEEDPEGRLIMQLAQHLEFYNHLLNRALDRLRANGVLTADTILTILDESPVFSAERRPLLQDGIQAYIDGDHTKAVHVIIPQVEQALRELLGLMHVPVLKAGRNGTMQLKNLNDILREPTIKQALGEDMRHYLLTFLADERGQNIRNTVCHGLAAPGQFNQRLADQVLHALLAVSLVRQKKTEATTLLFQYGSNCDSQRLNSVERLDGAATDPILVETVDEYGLAFNVWSTGNKCAASNLVPMPGTGRHVWGILYQVPTDRIRGQHPEGKKTMTQIEGKRYDERLIKVRTASGEIRDAITFIVRQEAQQDGLWTSSTYTKHIVDGLRAHNAPPEYIDHVIEIALATNERATGYADEATAATIAEQNNAIRLLQ